MSDLKDLSKEDLSNISDFFGDALEEELSKGTSIKELEDINIDFVVNYKDKELDVSVDLDISYDQLSNIDQDLLNETIQNAYLKLDSFLEENYRE